MFLLSLSMAVLLGVGIILVLRKDYGSLLLMFLAAIVGFTLTLFLIILLTVAISATGG